jgi:integrase
MHGSAHGRVTHWDAVVKHFGVRITPAGVKTFIVLLGSGRRQSIGRYPIITLAQAREKAKRILAERTLGRHQASSITWQAATEKFIEACRSKNRLCTHAEYERTLKRYFAFGTIRLSEISKQQISQKLEKLNKTPSQRGHALVICKMFFRWAIESGYLDVDPTAAFKRSRQKRRARVLSDEELRSIWRACEQMAALEDRGEVMLVPAQRTNTSPRLPASYCTIIKLLLVTGQRRGEIAALDSSWIKGDTITLPSNITKNGIEHTFPFGELGATILADYQSRKGLLFPARGKADSPFNGWSKSMTMLRTILGKDLKHFTLHDARRTYRSNLGRVGVPPHIAERLVNHVNARSDMELVYDRYTYMPEMRAAVERFNRWFSILIGLQRNSVPEVVGSESVPRDLTQSAPLPVHHKYVSEMP